MKILGNIVMTTLAGILCLAGTRIAAGQISILYVFPDPARNYPNGGPVAGLLRDSKGDLFGVTGTDGVYDYDFTGGSGTAYELIPIAGGGWTYKELYEFDGISDTGSFNDGINPNGPLISDSKGNLYGVTRIGGDGSGGGAGTVFILPSSGNERAIWAFGSPILGMFPIGDLVFDAQGNLYGTTSYGGTGAQSAPYYTGSGIVFQLTPLVDGSWTEKVLYNFGSTPTDGANPMAGLAIDSSGTLYGTTSQGGTASHGTVFELVPQKGGGWTETVLHNFDPSNVSGGGDGADPLAPVILDGKGNLFGTTFYGGTGDCGTAFELSPPGAAPGPWVETAFSLSLTSYTGGPCNPYAGVTLGPQEDLYGTTEGGGQYQSGAVYELTPQPGGAWNEQILYSFNAYSDNFPYDTANTYLPTTSVTLDPQGNLYSTTSSDGESAAVPGYPIEGGTVFELAHVAPAGALGTILQLSANPMSSSWGQTVSLKAVLSPSSSSAGGTTNGETVSFYADGVLAGTAKLNAGVATLNYSRIAGGDESLMAVYGGDANFMASTSSALSLDVLPAQTQVVVASGANPQVINGVVNLTATVKPVLIQGTPTGNVSFFDGKTLLGRATLVEYTGLASLEVTFATAGPHTITAVYVSDHGDYTGSSSLPIVENIN